jgi:predicted dehydrogenase
VFAAAKEKGVFVMEAMWTRFYTLVQELKRQVHELGILGDVYRAGVDFGMDKDIRSLGPESRYVRPDLGAGSLLDIGVYGLTWGLLALDAKVGGEAEMPKVLAAQTLENDVDVMSAIILHFQSTGRQGVITCTTNGKGEREFARVEGRKGVIKVEGMAPSTPESFTFYPRDGGEAKRFEFEKPGRGFWWEADACAVDIQQRRTQNAVMPWGETMRVMEIMDEVRRMGGAKFPQDGE